MTATNLAFYKFARVEDPDALVDAVAASCTARELLGKIVIAEEGINGMVAGSRAQCDGFAEWLRQDERFADVVFKVSECDVPPFGKLVVRHKPEIVTMRVDDVDVVARTARHLPPEQLRDWLRAAEPITLIDVRNDYEVGIGTFRGALDPATAYFNEFPQWVREHRAELEERPVVMFCTGGIRCEKATSWMLEQGFENVWQLDGGVLNYFERIEDAEHDWDGELFVFDERVAVDTHLRETSTELCSRCGDPVPGGDDSSCECGRP